MAKKNPRKVEDKIDLLAVFDAPSDGVPCGPLQEPRSRLRAVLKGS
jgi:hypothetical protein